MGWNTIRKATQEDYERLEASAKRFAQRRGWGPPDDVIRSWIQIVESELDYLKEDSFLAPKDIRHQENLWKSCARRALRHPWATGIGWDYVGFESP
jgi:hypothetical protein